MHRPSPLLTILIALFVTALLTPLHTTVVWGDSTENAAKVRVATMLLASPGSAKTFDVSAPSVVSIR